MTTEQPPDREHTSPENAVLLESLNGILRTGGIEPTTIKRENGGKEKLIKPNKICEYEDHLLPRHRFPTMLRH